MLEIRRKQHPVGQGGFHSGSISEDGRVLHRYVYDCGATAGYASARDDAIDRHIASVGAGSKLHTLVLSHIHADHINGLERLLEESTGLRVDTIILPLVNHVDRLISYARTAAVDPVSARSAFYQALVVNPTSALSRFEPRVIIYVEPGDRGVGAPADFGPDPDPKERGRFDGDPSEPDGPAWTLVGTGSVIRDDARVRPDQSSAPVRTLVVSDTQALLTASSSGAWLLAPFVDPSFASDREDFLDWLAAIRRHPRRDLEDWLSDPANVLDLVANHASDLVAAYSTIERNLNVTSLLLYSGPARRPPAGAVLRSKAGRFEFKPAATTRTAWLATGDAALGDRKRRDDFLTHYRDLVPQAHTFMLAHHGSDHNFHPELLDTIEPALCIAAADAHGDWRHPGTRAVQAVCSRGSFLQVVTSDERSTVEDEVTLP
ncbi:hypothetical protein ASE67_06870 [Sphingomonas sp. Leaf23]|uniref:hypothetical protein n=1 Tax=Sphingomonas sp. Leaf23 TaxID=1735689 RepID=UPI0006FF22F8|nr:hypothetical protein [Sphingomonas sp. Leaf23]KQM87426.1 hypothetical protein ASE67_06870 [Sphingomonas sp. Leaf23]